MVVKVLARLITIISERSRKLGQVTDAWRKINVAPIFKIVQKSQRTISWLAFLPSLGKPSLFGTHFLLHEEEGN